MARLIAGHICIHACMAGMRMAAPLLALRQGHSAAVVGVLLALFSLTQVFLALPAGRFADRHGLKRPMRWSVGIACAGAALAVAFPVFPVLCLTALTTGGAAGAASIALQRHVGRAATNPTQLKQVFSWLSIGPAVSNFIGPFSAGLLIDHGGATAGALIGYQAAFALLAVLPLAAWFWVRHVQELPPVLPSADAAKQRAWDLLREPMMRRLMVVSWLLSSCWDVHTFVVPVLGHERGMSATVIGTILGAFAVAAVVIRMLLPLLAAHLKEWAVMSSAMGLSAVIFGVYPLMDSALAMGVCSVLLGLALGSVQPMVMSTLHQITPHHRQGEALGLRLMLGNACSVLMPLLFGTAGALVGVASIFWTVGLLVGAGMPVARGLRLRR